MERWLGSTDEQLLEATASGEEEAFVEIYRRYHERVYRFAYHMTGSAAAAEDVTHSSFASLLESPRGFRPGRAGLGTYLCAAARNQNLKRLRQTRHEVPCTRPAVESRVEGGPLQSLLAEELAHAVRDAVLPTGAAASGGRHSVRAGGTGPRERRRDRGGPRRRRQGAPASGAKEAPAVPGELRDQRCPGDIVGSERVMDVKDAFDRRDEWLGGWLGHLRTPPPSPTLEARLRITFRKWRAGRVARARAWAVVGLAAAVAMAAAGGLYVRRFSISPMPVASKPVVTPMSLEGFELVVRPKLVRLNAGERP